MRRANAGYAKVADFDADRDSRATDQMVCDSAA